MFSIQIISVMIGKCRRLKNPFRYFIQDWDSQKFADMLRKFHLVEDGEHSVLFSTHITGDLERAADYITYISYGELFFTGSKDDFVDMFRIVKGGIEELSDDLKNKAAGIRIFPTGFEALMKIMSNILKSAKLDIALVKPYFKTICFTLLLPIVFAAINRSLLTGVSFAMCFIAMTTGYTFSITEKNSMDRLFGILPVRKSELVIGRYVFVLAMGLLSLVISLDAGLRKALHFFIPLDERYLLEVLP